MIMSSQNEPRYLTIRPITTAIKGQHWLTEEEQLEVEQKDEEQRTDLHTRKKQVLKIAF